ncbi:hypothetical protein GCM10009868_16220 [Terrabacter aerolatus]|uniref:HPr kinase n=1 Tax=Terrabacter aerolatus TaxID=422442 RepID=A0A512D3N0_9MICO|nr:hypothetical protein [Terrabacter aerolatus]GEO31076.1 hypothetical protein TAE01_28860 [Terrabacter aerolatus]
MTHVASLYGLTVAAPFPLHVARPAPRGPVDVQFVLGAPIAATSDRPPGVVVVHRPISDEVHATYVRTDDGGYLLRFARTCDFVIDASLGRITMHMAQDVPPEMGAVIALGTVLSFVLLLRGDCVLHASAVQVGGHAIGFVGHSGMGKSTMAALMCADGGRVITDDVLRLTPRDGLPRCALGATELRLRSAAGALADDLVDTLGQDVSARSTADERSALQLPTATEEDLELAALVIPRPRRDLAEVSVTLLDAKSALLTLIRFPRVVGVVDPVMQGEQFDHLAWLVATVPVYLGDVPWGPPFPTGTGRALASLVGASGRVADPDLSRESAR